MENEAEKVIGRVPAEYVAITKPLFYTALNILRDKGEIAPVAFVIKRFDDEKMDENTLIGGGGVYPIMLQFDSAESHEKERQRVYEVAKRLDADAVLMFAEAWRAPAKFEVGQMDQVAEYLDARGGTIKNDEDKINTFFMLLETQEGSYVGSADILPGENGTKGELGRVQWVPAENAIGAVRGFLPLRKGTVH